MRLLTAFEIGFQNGDAAVCEISVFISATSAVIN
jgi:hypothetical protein